MKQKSFFLQAPEARQENTFPDHRADWRRAASGDLWPYDQDVQEILGQGTLRTVRALLAVLDDIDSRLGLLEYTLAEAGITPAPGGIPDPESARYYAFYALAAGPGVTP